MANITLVGAGSAAFALTLANDICKTKSLEGSSLTLMDIDGKKLDAVYSIVRKLIEKKNGQIRIKNIIPVRFVPMVRGIKRLEK